VWYYNIMRKWLLVIVGLFLFARSPSLARAQTQQAYQTAMVTYRQAQARFDRDRQLYQARSGMSWEQLLTSANDAYRARQLAAYRYVLYLEELVNSYVTDQTVREELITKLESDKQAVLDMTVSFTSLGTWTQADSENTVALASLTETAYQSFAQIYYQELAGIIDTYITLYQEQNQRILAEAANEIQRQEKAKTLAETERTLQNLRAQIAAARPNLNFVNSQPAYTNLRDQLDQILATTQTSLKVYASLE